MNKSHLKILRTWVKDIVSTNSENMQIISNTMWENTTSLERKNDLDMLHETMRNLNRLSSIVHDIIDEVE